ncbi:MAG: phosphoribosylanthranilate isomerase [Deltaproteobacteria bacterium]|nr:phosphoribosylanthranilate isomerase [Deltaproteobacteria bacterium]
MKPKIKICGITSAADGRTAAQAGADYIGIIVNIDGSPRSVAPEQARAIIKGITAPAILLIENKTADIAALIAETKAAGIQIIGDYPIEALIALKKTVPVSIWQSVRIPQSGTGCLPVNELEQTIDRYHSAGLDAIVLDTLVADQKGGTGKTCDWDLAAHIVSSAPLPVYLAGGITPKNAADAVQRVAPHGIDLSSGVEKKPGIKDPQKIADLFRSINSLQLQQGDQF